MANPAPSRRLTCLARQFAWLGLVSASHSLAVADSVVPLAMPPPKRPGFTLTDPAATGLRFTNGLPDNLLAANRMLELGSGVALGDVNGDGRCDIYLCRMQGPNGLFINEGNWRFTESAVSAGVACPGSYNTGAVLADVDGDGDLDLLVSSLGNGVRLFLNDGHGHFTESTESGLLHRGGATSMALADIDGNGTLDLYVAHYRAESVHDMSPEARRKVMRISPQGTNDRFMLVPDGRGGQQIAQVGEADMLYLNDGKGHFHAANWRNHFTVGAESYPELSRKGWGLSAMFYDANQDGRPDLYVCNDFLYFPDRFWENQGQGRFAPVSTDRWRESSWSSMAVDFADIDRDGRVDFFVADMLSPHHEMRQRQRVNFDQALTHPYDLADPASRPEIAQNTLFWNRGDGTYSEVARLAGIEATGWTWSAAFLDVDLDGYEDLLVTTGTSHNATDSDPLLAALRGGPASEAARQISSVLGFPPLPSPLGAYRNTKGLRFIPQAKEWGLDFTGVVHGMAFGDLDGDGDLDIVMNRWGGNALVFRNDSTAPRIAVRLESKGPNTRGIGARLKVSGGAVTQTQQIIAGGRYLSSDEPARVFAGLNSTQRWQLEVAWPSGQTSVVREIPSSALVTVSEPTGNLATTVKTNRPAANPLFKQLDLPAAAKSASADELAANPLLPHALNHAGPGLMWETRAGNTAAQLVVGATSGSGIRRFTFSGNQASNGLSNAPPEKYDHTSILPWSGPGAGLGWLAGRSVIPGSAGDRSPVASFQPADVSRESFGEGLLPAQSSQAGALALGDMEGNGNLLLLVAGRLIPGQYPLPATSKLCRWKHDTWQTDLNLSAALVGIGLVQSALFGDLDGDGKSELILACDWGQIRIFSLRENKLVETTAAWGLDKLKGRWNSVAAGDFNGDGRLDLVAGNWGSNTPFERFREQPLRLYYGDFAGRGAIDTVEAYYDPDSQRYVPWWDMGRMSAVLNYIPQLFPTYAGYAQASISDVLRETGRRWPYLEVNTLESTLLINTGAGLMARPLPIEAQLSPVYGIGVGDFDGDGNVDLCLGQNFFGVEVQAARYAAGHGLLLLGNGDGTFHALNRLESGIDILGEQRAVAVGDFDGDGREDIAVSQYAGAPVVLRNLRSTAGITVTLEGGKLNPLAAGAVVRWHTDAGWGPAQEIHLGHGHFSCDSPNLILHPRGPNPRVWIRWPGGSTEERVLAAGQKHFTFKVPPGQ